MNYADVFTSFIIPAIVSFSVARYSIKSPEWQSKIDKLCDRIETVEREADAYWNKSGRIPEKECFLKSQLQYIGHDIVTDLKNNLVEKNDVNSKLINLRREITGGCFESPDRSIESGRINCIREAANNLRTAIKKCKPCYYF